MIQHRTTQCSAHGHREFTLQLSNAPPLPDVHRMLIGFLEDGVAGGATFLPGQIIRIGWAVLRLTDRADGTLGVEERELLPDVTWIEQVDRALRDTWMQKEVCASVGLLEQLTFPLQDEAVMVAECALEAETVILTRFPLDGLPPDVSGWALCCAEDHDHGERSFVPLLAVAANQPGLVQFFGLPHDTVVVVQFAEHADAPGAKRIRPTIFRQGDELAVVPGSYVAALRGD